MSEAKAASAVKVEKTAASGQVMRKCDRCKKKEKKNLLQRRAVREGPEMQVPPIVHEVLRSPGQPLDAARREFMEPKFGQDFSHVRVHTDSKAAESARAVNALAYTVGRHIVLPDRGGDDDRLLAHELAHVVQQRGGDPSVFRYSISSPNDEPEREAVIAADAVSAGRSFYPSLPIEAAIHREVGPPGTLSGISATRQSFKNTGAPDAANCAPGKPAALGVNGPAIGLNGMEMIFRINGTIPPGTEFDITRTRTAGLWQRNAAVWSRLGGNAAGTNDDHHADDECLTPVGARIFVIDTPGLNGSLNPSGVSFLGGGTVAGTATAAVWKLSFAEWVIARNRSLGIGWTRISTPVFHRWHSIFSVALVGGVWTRVNTPSGQHNEIRLGSIPVTGASP